MYSYEKSLRFGISTILCAVVIRLFSAGLLTQVVKDAILPQIQTLITSIQARQDAQPFSTDSGYLVQFTESPPAVRIEEPPAPTLPLFSEADTQTLAIYNTSGKKPDAAALLTRPMSWETPPAILILSTHSTESYRHAGEDYQESAPYRTLDKNYNMLSIGSLVAEKLAARGITVYRDADYHDYPSYNRAYAHARKAIQSFLSMHPDIQIVLDLHRDAADSGKGQLRTCALVDGQESAQLMLVMGTDASGLAHSGWEENLSFGLKLHTQLERAAPGITRPLCLRSQRFNQDLCPGALIVEIGAAGNTHAEALIAAEVLAQALSGLLTG